MSFDDLQHEWQSHDHGTRLNVDADLLLQEVRRQHRELESTLFRRDVVEVVAAAIVTGGFACFAVLLNEWTLYLCSLGGLFVGAFFIVDRWIQRRRQPVSDDSLESSLQASVRQVNHQIWLLRNIVWWYLLPLAFGLVGFLGSIGWNLRDGGVAAQIIVALVALVCAGAFWVAYRLNQQAVKKTFEPRRKELESLLASLKQ